ncbi:MAG: hypothetical protein M5U01_38760 [Ardenticatenaceae bacterium]|nr:hypothetical protein [Ardenticatenaceae bacterium]
MNHIVWLNECRTTDTAKLGGKNANLGELIRTGIRVPPGFAVTVDAYKEAVEQAGIQAEMSKILAEVQVDDIDSVDAASQNIRQLFESMAMPMEIAEAVDEYYTMLTEQCDVPEIPVAVRSSSTAEDLADASFAGQQETYLWVQNKDQVKKHIIKCWSSLFTARAISYRIKKGFPHERVAISVGVQKMVNAKVAGVLFTLNPITGDRSRIALCASWGLGEPVVSGEVTPDEWLIDKFTFEVVRCRLAPKAIEYAPDFASGKVTIVDVPDERQNILCLSDEEISELARLATVIENHYGTAQDIEWAIDHDFAFPENVFIVQSRPETVWSRREVRPVVQREATALDYILGVLSGGTKLK